MKNEKQLTGHVYRRGDWWIWRYRIRQNDGKGKYKIVHKAKRLCRVDAEHRTKRSVMLMVQEEVLELNQQRASKSDLLTLGEFFTDVYKPHIEKHCKPSTRHGYLQLWSTHCEGRKVGHGKDAFEPCKMLLRDFKTFRVQQWLDDIERNDKTSVCAVCGKLDRKLREKNHRHARDHQFVGISLTHSSLLRIRSLLSGIFTHALNQQYLDGVNPVTNTTNPQGAAGKKTKAYSVEQVETFERILPEPARTVVATLAWLGLRAGEGEGLRWEDWHTGVGKMFISRSVWDGEVQDSAKTPASCAPVPVLPKLATILTAHRERLGNPESGWMFPSGSKDGKPIRFHNVYIRQIKPILERCAVCHISRENHDDDSGHKWKADQTVPTWHGWHGLRRFLATYLSRRGVRPAVLKDIMRHADISTTLQFYDKPETDETTEAMENAVRMDDKNRDRALDCTQKRALDGNGGTTMVN